MKVFIIKKGTLTRVLPVIMMIILGMGAYFILSDHSKGTFIDPHSGIVVIDPGHGGIDSGTSYGQVLEKDINLKIALELKFILEQKGYKAVLTREKDESLEKLSPLNASRHRRDLDARTGIINQSNAQLFLSIHVNYHPKNTEANSAIVFYNNKFPQNKALAYHIQRPLNGMVTDGRKRTTHDPQTGNYYVLSQSHVPGVIIETGFLSNPYDRELLQRGEFRESLASSIAEGAEKYLKEQSPDSPQKAENHIP